MSKYYYLLVEASGLASSILSLRRLFNVKCAIFLNENLRIENEKPWKYRSKQS